MRAGGTRVIAVAAGLALALVAGAGAQGRWAAPASEAVRKNPIAASLKIVAQGKKVAQANCVSCHGATGTGNGPAAIALNPKPADWTSKEVQAETDGALFWKITSGRGAMPALRHLTESDRWALVQYIRSLKK
jgi:mono/diheme cytochrome c family protein